jgi:hypothetical protein
MIFRQALLVAVLFLAGSVFTLSCTHKSPELQPSANSDSAQYSIRAYVRGQIRQLYDQPLVLDRIEQTGNARDSSFVPITALDWKNVIPAFVKSDISAPEFIGQYRFSIADDDLTATRVLTYDALRPDLFTRIFQISTDVSNNLIRSVYIETRESGFWKKRSQKLLYVPNRVIQIQETEDPLIGGTRQRRLEYRFASAAQDEPQIVE